jgi:hypothetical protein
MFHVPVVKNDENGHLRQRGKVAELALGYGGSVGALKAMDAVRMGIFFLKRLKEMFLLERSMQIVF